MTPTPDRNRLFDHLEDLHLYARHLTRDMDRADDLVQDVVLHLLSKDAPLEALDNPRAYMARSLRNLHYDQSRARKSRPEQVEWQDGDAPDLSGEAFQSLACAETLSAIARLPKEFREVMRLRVEVGLSYAEMAEELDVPIGTVMSRISRARERLRELI